MKGGKETRDEKFLVKEKKQEAHTQREREKEDPWVK